MTIHVAEFSTERLDVYLVKKQLATSRSEAAFFISNGHAKVNQQVVKPSYRVQEGDQIEVIPPPVKPSQLVPHHIDFDILHEDKHIIVLNKPAGLVVHPGAGNYDTSLVHGLLHHCQDLAGVGGVERPGIVHRLDKGTSGVMIVAKNNQAHQNLTAQFQDRTIKKEYKAIVAGELPFQESRLENLMKRAEMHRKKFVVNEKKGKIAITLVSCLAKNAKASYVAVSLETGRTHQIRVHLSYLHHPILGDELYGGTKKLKLFSDAEKTWIQNLGRPLLHSHQIGFLHPHTRKRLEFEAPLPPEFLVALEKFDLTTT